ncbi:hypothetical protein STRAU_0317 [Streptomyces aurantiacus JA 4570]|uniref:Uncharacterized protein n=1 Tax=Streptomyces aurantiacus JA 4570 TaxID=1286094 RepID=S4A791_9ACTN|nr:hypothetical protein STRAU_0317 [Streptomyces aurantiacus JA 4570]
MPPAPITTDSGLFVWVAAGLAVAEVTGVLMAPEPREPS